MPPITFSVPLPARLYSPAVNAVTPKSTSPDVVATAIGCAASKNFNSISYAVFCLKKKKQKLRSRRRHWQPELGRVSVGCGFRDQNVIVGASHTARAVGS